MSKPDTFQRGLEALTDLGLTPAEALQRFMRIARRWTEPSRRFALHCGGCFRVAKMESAYDEAQSLRWADDGGRVP